MKTVFIHDRKVGRREVPGHTFTHEIAGEKFEFTWHKNGSCDPTVSHARSGFRVCDVLQHHRDAAPGYLAAARRALDDAVERNGVARVRSLLVGAPDLPPLSVGATQ